MSLHRNNVVTLSRRNNDVIIDLIHKYHNAQVPHPTMHHFVTEMCTCVHFSVAKWCIVGHLSNALCDLWDGSIALCVRWDRTTLPLRPRLHYIKHTVHWLHCSGCWFHLSSAYLHIIIKWPMPLGARLPSIKNVNKILQRNLYILSMTFLMTVQSFKMECSLVFHNLYIVHACVSRRCSSKG